MLIINLKILRNLIVESDVFHVICRDLKCVGSEVIHLAKKISWSVVECHW